MTLTPLEQKMVRDVTKVLDSIWANAPAAHRAGGPSDLSRQGVSAKGAHRISQEGVNDND